MYFEAYLLGRLLAEIEVYAGAATANPATVYLRLLDGGQYVQQQEMAHEAVEAWLAEHFAGRNAAAD
ncbi:hypothetical protein [Hymenobacter sp. CRA2]|uniref:hypothetical protein n=1 Tax=Hymenobacter sp. CRA2 TaxID=1955620 RepID=UPI00098F1B47|nr:hypothetical protein [Hymenobacter sp. CRA2]OON68748.1 hypothetical protein B0919_11195 [Hymenobacter sp. CRA2]